MAVGQIISRAIATGAIGADQIATGAITAADIPAGEITADKLHQTLDFSTKTFTMANAHVTQAMVTQHQSALSVTESQVSDLQSYVLPNTSPTFTNTTLTGYLAGPASFVIDPAGVGDNTGTVVIAGNLQVDGTQTTINSTTVSIDDLKLSVATDAADSAAANGAGITVGGANANITYTHATTSWDFDKPVNVTGAITATGISQFSDVNIPDNNAIRFGNSQDLQIYHNGSNSYIDDAGTGNLQIRASSQIKLQKYTGENMFVGIADGAASMYYDNSQKIATTSTGIIVTGNIIFGDNHAIVSDGNDNLVIESSSSEDIIIKAGSGVIEFRDAGESGSPLQMKIDTDGNVLVGGNVNDTTPYNNSAGSTADNGIALGSSGIISAAKYNDSVLLLNRTGTNDGSIIDVKKNGNTVGTIGTVDSDLNVYATASGHKGLRFGNGYLAPTGNSTTVENGTTDLGLSTHRFKDLYMTGTANIGDIKLDAIAKDISDTAVDVFVYDTSKDSDGGAWRKRIQHTSWYNEAASATRSSRKEFPAVAVITLQGGVITIYDGDDPDMPMWMKFTQSSGQSFTNGGQASYVVGGCGFATTSGINMLNGTLVVPHHGGCTANDTREGLLVLNFLSEVGEWITYTTAANFEFAGPISNRNTSMSLSLKSSTRSIVNTEVNDVAMTVLPNSQIDSAT